MFFARWVLYPCVLKALIYKGFQPNQFFVRDINTTVSTWLDCSRLMSKIRRTEPFVLGNISTVFLTSK
jgi:hypothetical protein